MTEKRRQPKQEKPRFTAAVFSDILRIRVTGKREEGACPMGTYLNPGNQAFREIAGPHYVDKTGLIALMNKRIDTDEKLVCISRPRRFGKSFAAKMLTAYYDCSCDSHELFDHRKIGSVGDYDEHINQYNVICIDVSGFISDAETKTESVLPPSPMKKCGQSSTIFSARQNIRIWSNWSDVRMSS